jgi:hypothetical protein
VVSDGGRGVNGASDDGAAERVRDCRPRSYPIPSVIANTRGHANCFYPTPNARRRDKGLATVATSTTYIEATAQGDNLTWVLHQSSMNAEPPARLGRLPQVGWLGIGAVCGFTVVVGGGLAWAEHVQVSDRGGAQAHGQTGPTPLRVGLVRAVGRL